MARAPEVCFSLIPSIAPRSRRSGQAHRPCRHLWPAIPGCHPAGRRYATLKMAPGHFLWLCSGRRPLESWRNAHVRHLVAGSAARGLLPGS
ncbi:hypothetical protein C5L43_17225 [Ectopseudomonas oleovorans]|nr:hypothetical protein C5L43_17225 [Pseudomonas oleovorans]